MKRPLSAKTFKAWQMISTLPMIASCWIWNHYAHFPDSWQVDSAKVLFMFGITNYLTASTCKWWEHD